MSDPIWRWSATRIAAGIRARDISAREALAACIERMQAINPMLNAVTVDLSDVARSAADEADRAVARGDALGALHGVPVTIKENVDQAGCATTNGVVGFRNVIAKSDSPIVANWKRAGAIILGRTNTPAFSFRLDTVNDLRGRTYSPWSKTHTPGGSSGGASSSVAAGITPLAHGNDIAGSVRFPAYACGLAGLRPSFGRVPAFNPTQAAERSMSSQLMSVQGPLARCVADVRLGLQAMAARDARDPWWVPAPLEGAPLPKRVAVVTAADDLGGAKLHPHVAAAIERGARWLADAGYEIVDEPTPGFTRAKELWFEMQMPEFRDYMLPIIEKEGDEGIRTAVRFKLENVPPSPPLAYMKALAERSAAGARMDAVHGARSTRSGADLLGARVRARLRHRERGAHRGALARVCDDDGGARARVSGDGGSDGRRGRIAHGCADHRAAFSRRPLPCLRRGDRGACRRHHADRSAVVSRQSRPLRSLRRLVIVLPRVRPPKEYS